MVQKGHCIKRRGFRLKQVVIPVFLFYNINMSIYYKFYILFLALALPPMTIGMYMMYSEKQLKEKCRNKIMGTVTGYRTKGVPKYEVEYCVQGKVYLITNEYRRVSRVPSFMAANKNQVVYLDGANVLHTIIGVKYDKEAFLKKLMPINSRIPVFYDANDPNNAYVKEVPAYSSSLSNKFAYSGIVLMLISFVFNFLSKR